MIYLYTRPFYEEKSSTHNLRKFVKYMEKTRKETIAIYLRNIARYTLLVVGILVFIFALLSGSEGYGGGVMGVIKISPNALPWLGLLVCLFIAWKWELLGGILITGLGIFLFVFFIVIGGGFGWASFVVSVIPIISGAMFILNWCLTTCEKRQETGIRYKV